MKTIGYRQWNKDTVYYVAQLPGEGGVDWGYVTRSKEARHLPRYWQRRFRKDCERVGSVARFITIGR